MEAGNLIDGWKISTSWRAPFCSAPEGSPPGMMLSVDRAHTDAAAAAGNQWPGIASSGTEIE